MAALGFLNRASQVRILPGAPCGIGWVGVWGFGVLVGGGAVEGDLVGGYQA
jgi:hypothetical protein